MRDYVFPGGTAVVTGAASGIGRALAGQLAERGSHLVLLDRDGDRLASVAADLRSAAPGVRVTTHVVELGDRAATAAAARAVLAEAPRPTLLVNNAGGAVAGMAWQLTFEELWDVVEVDLRAAVQLTQALLPALRATPGSHVVNVSSVFGVCAPPAQSAYATAKFGLRGYSEALRIDLAGRVGVTTVLPGGVDTRFADDARLGAGVPRARGQRIVRAFDAVALRIPPERVATKVLDGVRRRRARVLVGASAVLPDLLVRLAPGGYTTAMGLGVRAAGVVLGRSGRR